MCVLEKVAPLYNKKREEQKQDPQQDPQQQDPQQDPQEEDPQEEEGTDESQPEQPQGEEVLINRKAFEEYQENEKKKTILIYKGLLTAFIAINIILISFIIIYRIQISAARSNINTL